MKFFPKENIFVFQGLQEAKEKSEDDKTQRLVVRPFPVHKTDSLMNEETDLTSYLEQLCSCSSIVNKLYESGILTEIEKNIAVNYLERHEGVWPDLFDIDNNAIIYLDSLAVTYFQQIEVLDKVVSNFEVFISPEQAKGEIWDHRSDLYQAGILFYELVLGLQEMELLNQYHNYLLIYFYKSLLA